MIPTYNCARFLPQAIASVLDQAEVDEGMEIVVVDDVSTTDDPEAVVSEYGDGRVRFVRNAANLGATENFNRCVELSCGALVHILHGDDFVSHGFYREIASLVERHPECAFFATRSMSVDEAGMVQSVGKRMRLFETPTSDASSILMWQPFRAPSVVIRRHFYERSGGFDPELAHCADWEMWVRAIRVGCGVVSSKSMAYYRVFEGNDSSRQVRSGEAIRDHFRIATRFDGLQGFDRQRFFQMWAEIAHKRAQWFQKQGDMAAYRANIAIYRDTLPAWSRPFSRFANGLSRVIKLANSSEGEATLLP
jgi:glycosyltransferase involved in cell wall biosynthesis